MSDDEPLLIVGTAEAAEILGVEPPRIPRWLKSGRLPDPDVKLASGPVWHLATIEAVRDGRPPNGSKRLPLVGLAEAAEILGVDKSQIGRWRREGKFPEPALEKRRPGTKYEPGAGLSATPVWWKRDIAALARKRKRTAAPA